MVAAAACGARHRRWHDEILTERTQQRERGQHGNGSLNGGGNGTRVKN